MSNINITAIKTIREKELKTFADLVYLNTFEKADYALFQDVIIAMEASATIYQEALLQAASRDETKIRLKNEAKKKLINNLVAIASAMDIAWPDSDKDYLKVEAGFKLKKTPQRKVVTYVEPPTSLSVFNLKQRGIIRLEWEKAENAVTTAFEFLQEDGSWKNGLYNNKAWMELTYPFGKRVVLRALTIGPGTLKSDYTEPVEVMVS